MFSLMTVAFLSLFSLAIGVAYADTTMTLEQAVHFTNAEGSDLVLNAGTYAVEPAEEWLRIIQDGGNTVDAHLIEAHVGKHDESLDAPLALSGKGENPDSHHIVLLLPDGKKYETVGTYSGVRSRGRSFRLSRQRLQALIASQRRARATEFTTPLFGGSGGTRNFNLDCGSSGVMIGMTFKAGNWLDALGLICQRVNRDGSLGDQFTRRAVGGSGGVGDLRKCEDGRVVGGIRVQSGFFVNTFSFYCPQWDASRKQPMNFSSFSDIRSCDHVCEVVGRAHLTPAIGSTKSDHFFCPGSKVGKALRGKYGTYIDSVRFVCDHWNK
jgi:hypothetical protein